MNAGVKSKPEAFSFFFAAQAFLQPILDGLIKIIKLSSQVSAKY